mmetsp:Transcript_30416/g.34668  ORF Transcript_30416/g.34668 Transcript_30416/m.34668 type:complete len:388 (+) Transcript_30416:106-1269(+)
MTMKTMKTQLNNNEIRISSTIKPIRICLVLLIQISFLAGRINGAFHIASSKVHHHHYYTSNSKSNINTNEVLLLKAKKQAEDTKQKERGFFLDALFNSNRNDLEPPEPLQTSQSTSPIAKLFKSNNEVFVENTSASENDQLLLVGGAAAATIGISAIALTTTNSIPNIDIPSIDDITTYVQMFMADPQASMKAIADSIQDMGPIGLLYFGVVYTVAEILALPAVPLTASAGYLFGVVKGTGVVLVSASIAAAVSFVIGRTVLRSFVEERLKDFPKFEKIDRAIGKNGFRAMLLLRLSPVFPFALSNYFYGASSIEFWPYFFGTMIGFAPGTIGYVATGEVSKALLLGDSAEGVQPWYVYVIGFTVVGSFLKFFADTAGSIIEDVKDE